MSSTIYANQTSTSLGSSRSPNIMEETGYNPPRANNRRSLSDRLRNLFGRNSSSSPNRATSNDRRPPTTLPTRQGASTPTSGKSSTDAAQLHAPTVPKLFGKKKSKLPPTANTPTTSKKKIKGSQKTNPAPAPPMEISRPIYQQEHPTSIQGQVFSPRTPEFVHGRTERLPSSSSSTYEVTATQGFRDYVVIDQTQYPQQVVGPDVDEFPAPPTYSFDRSRSPSMNRQRSPNTSTEYHYYHDNLTPSGSIPVPDIEVIPAPTRYHQVTNVTPSTNSRVITEKPPISPPTSSRPLSTVVTNPTQSNTTGARTTATTTADTDVPKLTAPTIPFGSTSSKKKAKRTKSQTGSDTKSSSSSTINKLAQQTPTRPDQSWTRTYGSLPDAEIIPSGSLTPSKPPKSNLNRYPGISAIIQHHMRLPPVYYNERPYTTTTTTQPSTTPTGSPRRTARFETSTTTLHEYEERQPWSHSIGNISAPSPSNQRHDGYIRPMTPQKPPVQPDVSIIRVDLSDLRRQSPSSRSPRSPRTPHYDIPEPPKTYRSSATIYTRDKHQHVDGGEIRTWSSHESGIGDDYTDSSKQKPYVHVQVDYRCEPQTNGYHHQIVPSKSDERYQEYRYSPRAHEQQLYEREHKIITDQEIQEEERYEVSYEYEQNHQHYAHETKSHYDQLHSTNRYSNDFDDDQNVTYANLTPTTRSSARNEREKIYDQSSRSYTSTDRLQEPLSPLAPVHHSKEIPRSYTLKRSDSYDGLGISISASSQARSSHIIRDVEPGSPGHRAGLRKNDRIISIDGINVENVDFSDVLMLIKEGLEKDNLQLSVLHESEQN